MRRPTFFIILVSSPRMAKEVREELGDTYLTYAYSLARTEPNYVSRAISRNRYRGKIGIVYVDSPEIREHIQDFYSRTRRKDVKVMVKSINAGNYIKETRILKRELFPLNIYVTNDVDAVGDVPCPNVLHLANDTNGVTLLLDRLSECQSHTGVPHVQHKVVVTDLKFKDIRHRILRATKGSYREVNIVDLSAMADSPTTSHVAVDTTVVPKPIEPTAGPIYVKVPKIPPPVLTAIMVNVDVMMRGEAGYPALIARLNCRHHAHVVTYDAEIPSGVLCNIANNGDVLVAIKDGEEPTLNYPPDRVIKVAWNPLNLKPLAVESLVSFVTAVQSREFIGDVTIVHYPNTGEGARVGLILEEVMRHADGYLQTRRDRPRLARLMLGPFKTKVLLVPTSELEVVNDHVDSLYKLLGADNEIHRIKSTDISKVEDLQILNGVVMKAKGESLDERIARVMRGVLMEHKLI